MTAMVKHNRRAARPSVSVLVTARGTPRRLERALRSVVANLDERDEAIVIDHGDATSIVPPEFAGRVRAIVASGPLLGQALFDGFAIAQGDVIAWGDECDVWAPGQLDALLGALAAVPDLAVAYGAQTWVDDVGAPAVSPLDAPWGHPMQPPFIAGGGMVARAAAIRRVGGFDTQLGAFADWDLCVRLSDWFGLIEVPAVTTLHEACPHRPEFSPAALDARIELPRHLMARRVRRPRHTAKRSAPRPQRRFDPATWRGERREIDVHSVLGGRHSYASVNAGLLPALRALGVRPHLASASGAIDPEFADFPRQDGVDRMGLFYEVGRRPRDVGVAPLLQYTMMEQAYLPNIHAEEINRYIAQLFVPSRMLVESFREGGVTVPIEVLHHGVDAARFSYIERPAREPFTFGTFGQQNERKGVDVLLAAFQEEFRPDEPVRLILNATMAASWVTTTDPRVEVRAAFLSPHEVIDYLAELDAFALPSRGEGFGLCGLEAMATGLPTIATNWSGPAEYLDRTDSFPLDYALVETGGRRFGALASSGRGRSRTASLPARCCARSTSIGPTPPRLAAAPRPAFTAIGPGSAPPAKSSPRSTASPADRSPAMPLSERSRSGSEARSALRLERVELVAAARHHGGGAAHAGLELRRGEELGPRLLMGGQALRLHLQHDGVERAGEIGQDAPFLGRAPCRHHLGDALGHRLGQRPALAEVRLKDRPHDDHGLELLRCGTFPNASRAPNVLNRPTHSFATLSSQDRLSGPREPA